MVFEIVVWLDSAVGICAEKSVAEPFGLAPQNTNARWHERESRMILQTS